MDTIVNATSADLKMGRLVAYGPTVADHLGGRRGLKLKLLEATQAALESPTISVVGVD